MIHEFDNAYVQQEFEKVKSVTFDFVKDHKGIMQGLISYDFDQKDKNSANDLYKYLTRNPMPITTALRSNKVESSLLNTFSNLSPNVFVQFTLSDYKENKFDEFIKNVCSEKYNSVSISLSINGTMVNDGDNGIFVIKLENYSNTRAF